MYKRIVYNYIIINEKEIKMMNNRRKSRKKLKREKVAIIMIIGSLIMLVISIILFTVMYFIKPKVVLEGPDIDVELLTVNEYSRPQTPTGEINGLVIHYTANPGTTAIQNRNYFEGLKDSGLTSASSHFIIGIDGEIVQCIPTKEIAYASNDRNIDTISIECCHADETGKFSEATYKSLVELSAWLCGKFGLKPKDIIRHYDITGKMCPLYYVDNEGEWKQFIEDVEQYIDEYGVRE